MTDTSPATARVLDAPPFAWEALADGMTDGELYDSSRDLPFLAVEAARRAAYFNARELGETHRRAVKASNRAARMTAKVMGYSYPRMHELAF